MFWNDIEEIKDWMNRLTDRLVRMDHSIEEILGHSRERSKLLDKATVIENELEDIKECLQDTFSNEDEYSSFNRIHDKLNALVKDADRQKSVLLAEMTLDKFDEYMKNVDKLNSMINEFKGCVSLARGALEERKRVSEQEAKTAVLADMTEEIHKAMIAFINAGEKLESKAHFKIDFIYKNIEKIADILQNCEKKSRKPRKSVKKKKADPDCV